MSKIVIAALIYWGVCIVIVFSAYFWHLTRGEAVPLEKPFADILGGIVAAPFVAAIIIAVKVIDLLDDITTKFKKK